MGILINTNKEMSKHQKDFKRVSIYLHTTQYSSLQAFCLKKQISLNKLIMVATKRYIAFLEQEERRQQHVKV